MDLEKKGRDEELLQFAGVLCRLKKYGGGGGVGSRKESVERGIVLGAGWVKIFQTPDQRAKKHCASAGWVTKAHVESADV